MARGAGILERTGDLLSGLANRLQAVNFGNPGMVNFGRKKDDDDKQTATQLGSALSEDRWSKLIDLLQDMNRGIWSLVGGEDLHSALPNNSQAPSPTSNEKEKPSILEKLDGLLTNFVARQSHAIRNPNSVQGIGQSIGSAGNLAGGLIGMIPGGQGIGAIVSGFGQLGEALANSVSQLQHWGHSLYAANMQLAEFSPSMAGVRARQEVRDFQLNYGRGERRAPAAEEAAEAMNKLDSSLSGMADVWESGKAKIFTAIVEVIAPPLEQISSVTTYIADLLGILKDDPKNKMMPLTKSFDDFISSAQGFRPNGSIFDSGKTGSDSDYSASGSDF